MFAIQYLLLLVAAAGADVPPRPAESIEIPSLIRLDEQVEVSAREAGIIAEMNVREGQSIKSGDPIARVDDTEAKSAEERAKFELEIANLKAANTVNVRFAQTTVEVARAELNRSKESNEKYKKSISETEMDRLRLIVENGQLEVERAQEELKVAAVTSRLKESEYRAAQLRVERHAVVAPLHGVVVQIKRHVGEWVEPGDTVARVLRLDRLRAEGFIKLPTRSERLLGSPVRLIIDQIPSKDQQFTGRVVFVDPEIDPVNAQVRIWAEVDNKDLQLQPGMRARMILDLSAAKP